MSPFIIFLIVFTLGLLLYYIAAVMIDLAALDKKEADEGETIDAGNGGDDYAHTPKSVVEDPETGGFSFSDTRPAQEPAPAVEPEPSSEIAEAEESQEDHHSTSDTNQESENPEETTSDEQQGDEPSVPQTSEGDANEPEEANDGDDTQAAEEETEDDDDDVDLETSTYQGEEVEEKKELFDVSQAFDQNLSQSKYDVSKVIEPAASEKVQQHANEVNDALESAPMKGNQHKSLDLKRLMTNKELSNKHNIETTDEQTRN